MAILRIYLTTRKIPHFDLTSCELVEYYNYYKQVLFELRFLRILISCTLCTIFFAVPDRRFPCLPIILMHLLISK